MGVVWTKQDKLSDPYNCVVCGKEFRYVISHWDGRMRVKKTGRPAIKRKNTIPRFRFKPYDTNV